MSGKVKVSHFIGMAVIEAFTQLFYTTKIFQISFKRSRFALEDLKRSADLKCDAVLYEECINRSCYQ